VSIRTGMLTSPNEIVPLQIGRGAMPWCPRRIGLENGTFASLESYSYRSHNSYMAGISLWTVWTADSPESRKPA
jgi:hypothetical protein